MKTWAKAALGTVIVGALAVGAAFYYLANRGMLPQPQPRGGPAAAPNAVTQVITKGEYLARAGDCVACHTEPGGIEFAGGRAMATPFGNLYVPNITPDEETGIGQWSAEEIVEVLSTGFLPDGDVVAGAMEEVVQGTSKLKPEDRAAIAAYLKSLPPIRTQAAK
jgi:mono/diheme cytochrome c family protein